MRPLVGVTKSKSFSGRIQNIAIRFALFIGGAKSINLTSDSQNFSIEIDGLLVSGGTDLYPGLYRNREIKKSYKYDRARDKFELSWLRVAKEKQLPIFCICRGAQLLNIFRGGTLHTDVSKVYENAKYPNSFLAKIFFRKRVKIIKNTRLDEVFRSEEVNVNSLHSQSIDEVGDGLDISAVEKNGVVQAIEADHHRYIVGVQFHPEFLFYRKDIRNLFKEFVNECSKAQSPK